MVHADPTQFRFAWQIRPKHHIYHHLALDMTVSLYSARFEHTFRDEGAMGLAKRCLSTSRSFVSSKKNIDF